MIPPIIHCCWFGGPKTKLALKCRASWEKFAPNFEIREWDLKAVESTGVFIPSFVRQALAQRKWAFGADWVRFLALSLEGGIYFDYDFELVAPIDKVVEQGPFVAGQWMPNGSVGMEPAILSLEKDSPISRAMLTYYETAPFDGKTTVGEVLAGFIDERNPLRVLPPTVFSPIAVDGKLHRTTETLGIHHYAMSWATPRRKIAKWLSWHGMRGLVELLLKWKAKG